MSISNFLNFYPLLIIIFFLLTSINLIFVYAQFQSSDPLGAPVTSKVIPYNFSISPSTSVTPKLTKVIPYNFSILPSTITPSYSVINVTTTFTNIILHGVTSSQFNQTIVPHTSTIIKGEK